MRLATNRFQHSLETIQPRFYHALRAIHSLRSMIIRLDYDANEHPGHFRESVKYYPWFKINGFVCLNSRMFEFAIVKHNLQTVA
ncbi:hypothetical protein CFP56_023187, partial [Quercus suber]